LPGNGVCEVYGTLARSFEFLNKLELQKALKNKYKKQCVNEIINNNYCECNSNYILYRLAFERGPGKYEQYHKQLIVLKVTVKIEYLEQWLKDKADNKENDFCELK
ncbi:11805_t:CDS:2, partial [Cetraspora pellucida]